MQIDNKRRFIIFHFLFLLSLVAVYYIPLICSMINDTNLPPLNRYVRFYMIGIFSLVFLFYYFYLYYYNRLDVSLFKLNGLSVYFWLTTTVVFLFLCSSYPLLSGDLFEYPIRGRMLTVYGLNPYIHTPMDIEQDMFFPLAYWKNMPERYGPAWVIIGTLHTIFFKNSLALTIFMHKLVLFIFLFLSCYLFYKICSGLKLQNPDILAAAFVTNPLIIIMTLLDGHNEIVMVFFILTSLYFLLRSKYLLSFLMFALSIQIKFVYIVIAPLLILYILLRPNGRSSGLRIYEIIKGGFLSAGVMVLLWLPFGKENFIDLFNYYKDLGRELYSNAIPYAIYFLLKKTGIAISESTIINIFSVVFFIIYIYLIYFFIIKIKTDKQAIFTASGFIMLTVIFTNYTPFNSWHLLWAIPFIFLSQLKSNFLLVFLLTYFLLMAFWKRMSVLVVPMAVLYFIMRMTYNRYENRLRFLFSLKGQ